MAYFKTILCLFLFILIIGCGASHHIRADRLYNDPDWTYGDIKSNGMAIPGISSQKINLTDDERLKYSMEISNILLEELKDAHKIRMINTLQCIDNLGRDQYSRIMKAYDVEKAITAETFTLLRDAMPGIKYMLIAYIENENVIDNSYEISGEDKKKDDETETEYKKTYLLSIDFRIYDLLQEKLVWNSVIFNQAENTESRTTRSGCFESFIDSIFQDILFGEPAEIDREEVLVKITDRLAEELEKQ